MVLPCARAGALNNNTQTCSIRRISPATVLCSLAIPMPASVPTPATAPAGLPPPTPPPSTFTTAPPPPIPPPAGCCRHSRISASACSVRCTPSSSSQLMHQHRSCSTVLPESQQASGVAPASSSTRTTSTAEGLRIVRQAIMSSCEANTRGRNKGKTRINSHYITRRRHVRGTQREGAEKAAATGLRTASTGHRAVQNESCKTALGRTPTHRLALLVVRVRAVPRLQRLAQLLGVACPHQLAQPVVVQAVLRPVGHHAVQACQRVPLVCEALHPPARQRQLPLTAEAVPP